MPQAERVSIVCRDCGEVGRFDLAGVKPGALVSCPACGLVVDPRPQRPSFDRPVGPAAGLGRPPPRAPPRGAARGARR